MPHYTWLVVGLGNPGRDYADTRHNIGWMAAEAFCRKRQSEIKPGKGDWLEAECLYAGKRILILYPTTYMNLSGSAVKKAANAHSIPSENVLVLSDEYNFPVGVIHLKKGGSDGGHNGLASVAEELGSANFWRMRFGIGRAFAPGGMADYVLSPFSSDELDNVQAMIESGVDALETILKAGAQRAMQTINARKKIETNISDTTKNQDFPAAAEREDASALQSKSIHQP